MIKIGVVNIDTSHPMGFAEVMEKDMRAKYIAIYNDSFRLDDEVEGFIKRFGVEKRCSTIEELADSSDIGFIQGCDWDAHIGYAMAFIERGKPVFIDKPVVGSLKDCMKLEELVRNGATIIGSSSARYAYEIVQFVEIPVEERGEIVSVYGTSGVDEFNYGIHIVEAIGAIAGRGAQSVKFIGKGVRGEKYSESFSVQFENGINAIYTTFTGTWQPFVITVMTTKTTYNFKIDSSKLYEALIGEICNYMEGKENHLVSINAINESIKIMLAGRISRENGGKEQKLIDIPQDDKGYNGRKFLGEYSAMAKKIYC